MIFNVIMHGITCVMMLCNYDHNFSLSNIIDCDEALANSSSFFDSFFLAFFSDAVVPCPSSEGCCFLLALNLLVSAACGVLLLLAER